VWRLTRRHVLYTIDIHYTHSIDIYTRHRYIFDNDKLLNISVNLQVALKYGVKILTAWRYESCKIVFLEGHFLFTCSDTLAVGCIILPQCTMSQTDRQTDIHYHANSQSYCVQYDRLKSKAADN